MYVPNPLPSTPQQRRCGSEMGEGLSVRDATAIVEARAPDGLDLINLYIVGSLKPKRGGNYTPLQQVLCWGC